MASRANWISRKSHLVSSERGSGASGSGKPSLWPSTVGADPLDAYTIAVPRMTK